MGDLDPGHRALARLKSGARLHIEVGTVGQWPHLAFGAVHQGRTEPPSGPSGPGQEAMAAAIRVPRAGAADPRGMFS
jgi:hypothetical protein